MTVSQRKREAWNFHLDHNGYSTPPGRALSALQHARAELALHNSEQWRARWIHGGIRDTSWMDEKQIEDVNNGSMENHGLIIERKCSKRGEWESVDSLWSIWMYTKDEDTGKRIFEAQVALDAGILD